MKHIFIEQLPENQRKTFYNREKFVKDFCKKKKWDMNTLTTNQILEIRKQKEWINA